MKNSILILSSLFMVLCLVISGCGGAASSGGGAATSASFTQQVAETIIDAAAQQSNAGSSSPQTMAVNAIKAMVGGPGGGPGGPGGPGATPEGFTPGADGWYTISGNNQGSGMTIQMKFWADAGETSYLGFAPGMAGTMPHHVEIRGSGSGRYGGQTMQFNEKCYPNAQDWGSACPTVHVISTSSATYDVVSKGVIWLNPTMHMTGICTVTATGAGGGPAGTITMTRNFYGTSEGGSQGPKFGNQTANGVLTMEGTTHNISATLFVLKESGSENIYESIYDNNNLIAVVNATRSYATISGTLLEMYSSPYTKRTISNSR